MECPVSNYWVFIRDECAQSDAIFMLTRARRTQLSPGLWSSSLPLRMSAQKNLCLHSEEIKFFLLFFHAMCCSYVSKPSMYLQRTMIQEIFSDNKKWSWMDWIFRNVVLANIEHESVCPSVCLSTHLSNIFYPSHQSRKSPVIRHSSSSVCARVVTTTSCHLTAPWAELLSQPMNVRLMH